MILRKYADLGVWSTCALSSGGAGDMEESEHESAMAAFQQEVFADQKVSWSPVAAQRRHHATRWSCRCLNGRRLAASTTILLIEQPRGMGAAAPTTYALHLKCVRSDRAPPPSSFLRREPDRLTY